MKTCRVLCVFLVALILAGRAGGQSTDAAITGRITDPTKAVIAGAHVTAINTGTNARYENETNNTGSYVIPNLPPGPYRVEVEKDGFKTVVETSLVLHVQDTVELNYEMAIGATAESITVTASQNDINTTDASVSTVIDRQFAENLPMNGRSFQTLIQLTPGVIVTPSTVYDPGQFSVDGQRSNSNYWMVDGVSANVGVGVNSAGNAGGGLGGSLGSFSALGGTNSLVSVDAMQEFRIETSTYAPEFGRTPGAQISIVTRSGTNQFHGTAFDYLRNDILDANNWFADHLGLPKPEERQNDFGGTLDGPIIKDRTFFFFSYEGLRLRLPQVAETTVPDANARSSAAPVMQAYLNAFPLPTPGTPDDTSNGIGQFNRSFSNAASLDAYSLRVDHKLNDKWAFFGRYNYSPSEIEERGGSGGAGGFALSDLVRTEITTQTATIGGTWNISPQAVNDVRFNYSVTSASNAGELDTFGGAVPLTSLPFPSPYIPQNAFFYLDIFTLEQGTLQVGKFGGISQRQFNLVDGLSIQRGSHSLKFGVDFRRLSPRYNPNLYDQVAYFLDVPSAGSGSLYASGVEANLNATFLLRDLGTYVQDTWRIAPRLTLTYGLRWDIEFVPQTTNGPDFSAVTGFDLNNLSQLALAPPGTRLFRTTYGNFAPRIGIAYQLTKNQDWQTVLRGGFGVFYDLATSELGNLINSGAYPFGGVGFSLGGTFPLDPLTASPPPIAAPSASNGELLYAFDPNLKLPYSLQWNFAVEQALGKQQAISVSYVGSAGRRLLQSLYVSSPSPNLDTAQLVTNSGTSNYNALQLQFKRRLSRGLQALASYTWSHSIDTGSAGSLGSGGNTFVPGMIASENRGDSDFDIRNAASAGITYDVPTPRWSNPSTSVFLRGWSVQTVVQARSAPPVEVYNSAFFELSHFHTDVRPDVVPGQPLYLYGAQYPGGKVINNTPDLVTCSNGSPSVGPFCPPPTDSSGNPLRQGDLGRNTLRGFGAAQWDFAVHRDFSIRESLKLQFRAEMFNVLNHPNFGQPIGDIRNPQFGQSTQTLGQSLGGGNLGGGGFDPLYQIGGPRSIQLALKLIF